MRNAIAKPWWGTSSVARTRRSCCCPAISGACHQPAQCVKEDHFDKSGANTAAIESVNADACVDIVMRENKYLNNIVEQDYRAVKRVTQPMLGSSHSGVLESSSLALRLCT
jgi:hypothetical protein